MKYLHYSIGLLVLAAIVIAGCSNATTNADTTTADPWEKLYARDPQRKYIGQEVGDLHFKDLLQKKNFHLNEDFKDKVVIIESFSVGCPSCVEGIKAYTKLYDKYQDNIEIIYLDISQYDTAEDIINIKEQYGGGDWIWTEYQGSLLPFYEQFNIYTNEQTFILDKTGEIAYADSFNVPIERVENAILKLI